VYLIFWGSWWGSNAAAETSVMLTASKVLSSPYLSGLTQYHSDGLAHVEPIAVYDSTNPSNLNFDTGKIDDVIQNAVDQGLLPEPDGPPQMPIYVVVTPPGIQSNLGTQVAGFNQVGHDVDFCGVMPCDFDDLPEIWSWTGNSKDINNNYVVNLTLRADPQHDRPGEVA
jgi:hypothetical protein